MVLDKIPGTVVKYYRHWDTPRSLVSVPEKNRIRCLSGCRHGLPSFVVNPAQEEQTQP